MNIKKELGAGLCFIQVNFKLNKNNKEGDGIYIEGFGSTDAKDCDSDVVKYSAWDTKAITKFLDNPQMLLSHDFNKSIGKWLKLERKISGDKKGLWVEGVVEHDLIEDGVSIKERIRKGTVRTLSIGFIPLKFKWINKKGQVVADETGLKHGFTDKDIFAEGVVRYISKVELFEISVVNIPANSQAIFALKKSLKINNHFILQNLKNMKTKLNLNLFKGRRTKEASITLEQIDTEFESVETVIDEVKEDIATFTTDIDTIEKKIESGVSEENAKQVVTDLETIKQEVIDGRNELIIVEGVLEQVNIEAMTKELTDADTEMVREKIEEMTTEIKEEIIELEKVEERIVNLYETIGVNTEDEAQVEISEDAEQTSESEVSDEEMKEGEDTEEKEVSEDETKEKMDEEKKEDVKEEITKESLKELIKEVMKEYLDDNSGKQADETSALEKSFSETITSLEDKIEKMGKMLAKAQTSVLPTVSKVENTFKIDTTGMQTPKSFSKKK